MEINNDLSTSFEADAPDNYSFEICCNSCKSGIEINSIKDENSKIMIDYKCQKCKNRQSKKEDLQTYYNKLKNNKVLKSCSKCKIHDEGIFNYYCQTCQKDICNGCKYGEHKDHEFVPYKDLFEFSSNLDDLIVMHEKKLEKIEKTKESITNWINQLNSKINNYFQKVQTYLEFQYLFLKNFDYSNLCYTKVQNFNYFSQDNFNFFEINEDNPQDFNSLGSKILNYFKNEDKRRKSAFNNEYQLEKLEEQRKMSKTGFIGLNLFKKQKKALNKNLLNMSNGLSKNLKKNYITATFINEKNKNIKILSDKYEQLNESNCKLKINDKEESFAKEVKVNNRLETVTIQFIIKDYLTDLSNMFLNCDQLQKVDLSNLDTSKVTSMAYMFNYCSSLVECNLSEINTSNVENIEFMFADCKILRCLEISNWNTEKLKNMKFLCAGCISLETIDISKWDTRNVKIGNAAHIFHDCNKIKNKKNK